MCKIGIVREIMISAFPNAVCNWVLTKKLYIWSQYYEMLKLVRSANPNFISSALLWITSIVRKVV